MTPDSWFERGFVGRIVFDNNRLIDVVMFRSPNFFGKRVIPMAAISGPDWSKLSSLDPELVRAFVAVVDSGGFTAAAKQLHRTQSTISLRIRTLEERLETHVFLRNSRRLALSRDGENFLIHARRIIQVQN